MSTHVTGQQLHSVFLLSAGEWRAFTGNEIGAMLAQWVLRSYLVKEDAAPPERLALLSSTVSSRMLESIAEKEGLYWQVGVAPLSALAECKH